jgi:hypothetical protein
MKTRVHSICHRVCRFLQDSLMLAVLLNTMSCGAIVAQRDSTSVDNEGIGTLAGDYLVMLVLGGMIAERSI